MKFGDGKLRDMRTERWRSLLCWMVFSHGLTPSETISRGITIHMMGSFQVQQSIYAKCLDNAPGRRRGWTMRISMNTIDNSLGAFVFCTLPINTLSQSPFVGRGSSNNVYGIESTFSFSSQELRDRNESKEEALSRAYDF